MARRNRTAKSLAQRIDLNYFRQPGGLRRWKFLLSAGLAGAAAVGVVVMAAAGHNKVYTAGPLSPAHAFVANRCEVCHDDPGAFRKHVRDQACEACHDGPVHQARQVTTPRCASCHAEHRGVTRLASIPDGLCTSCHADLQVREGKPRFERVVTDLNGRHPEFAPLRPGHGDPGTIKLNHQVHLKAGLKGPRGPVQMVCADCHRTPADIRDWPYAAEESRRPALAADPDPLAAPPTRAYMAPMKYEKQCAACHLLLFDKRFPEPVPHKEPKVVHEYVTRRYTEYIAAHPEALRMKDVAERRVPGEPAPAVMARNAPEWVTMQVAAAEQLLWQKTCKECHAVKMGAGPLPEIPKAQIAVRWLPHSHFSHESHRAVDCVSCHAKAPQSKETADVLIPGIATCRQCHGSHQAVATDAADARCSECHEYHDWSKEKPAGGKYTIRQLLHGK